MTNDVNGLYHTGMTTVEKFNEHQACEADKRHQPVIDAYVKCKSQAEVARKFGVTRSRVQAILRRARLRGLLDEDDA